MSESNIIKKITIQIGGKEVAVTPEEARNLYDALHALMGMNDSTQVVEKHIHHDYWRWNYWQPTWSGGSGITSPYTITYLTSADTAAIAIS